MSKHTEDEPHMRSVGDPSVDDAIEEIDASMFSGDALDDANAAMRLQSYLQRWERVLLRKFAREFDGADHGTHMGPVGNRHVDKAINEIDAAIFSSDLLDDINAALHLQKYLHRWQRGLLKKFTPEGQSAEYDPTAY